MTPFRHQWLRYHVNNGFLSGVINRVSEVKFQYYDYQSPVATWSCTGYWSQEDNPPLNAQEVLNEGETGKMNIQLTVKLPDVGWPAVESDGLI